MNIDGSIYSGETGSGKTENFRLILEHLVHLSSQKKETKLQSQINSAQLVLESFGNARTTLNDNASRFGKYVELQFNERGRMTGAKLLNYLLDKSRLTQCPSHEQTFHVFYQIFAGATAEEKTILQLNDDLTYRYIPRRMAASGKEGQHFKELKQAMKTLGISKKYQARLWQFVACLLHLGQLEFTDDPTVQEAAFVKNTDVLDICADFLGVDPRALENLMTYKTLMIKKDVTTIILDSFGASQQRDSIVRDLYSLLFSWLVEYLNTKLCTDKAHSFIGVLDFPGPRLQNNQSHNNFNSFCVNLANERLQHFCQRTIFEADTEEYRMEGLPVADVPYFNNQACVELLARPKHGLADLANRSAKSSNTDLQMLDSFVKYNNTHSSFSLKSSETGQRLFSVQHFAGQVTYSPDNFVESNKDILNAELVQLIRGSEHTPASFNAFVVELFADKSISTEHHPKQADAILNAQQPSGPLRGPSMRRSKSTKRNRTSAAALEPIAIPEEGPIYAKKNVSMLLSQLNKSLDDLFATLEETVPWFVFCIRPNSHAAPNQFDSQKVRAQIRAWGIPQMCEKLKTSYTTSYFHDEFMERYASLLEGMDQSTSPKDQCQAAIALFGWSSSQAHLGATKVHIYKKRHIHKEQNVFILIKDIFGRSCLGNIRKQIEKCGKGRTEKTKRRESIYREHGQFSSTHAQCGKKPKL